jgi:hypothetical protein
MKHHNFINLEQILNVEIAEKHFEYDNEQIHLRHERNTEEILIADKFWRSY